MLTTVLGKLDNLFDRHFIVGYCGPAIVGLALAILLAVVQLGPAPVVGWWLQRSLAEQIALGTLVLLGTLLLGYLLQVLTIPVVRFYEGYWGREPDRGWAIAGERRASAALARQGDELAKQNNALGEKTTLSLEERLLRARIGAQLTQVDYERHYNFPRDDRLLLPTRLGNVLRAAEAYAPERYGLDTAIWWPRLLPLLPEAFRSALYATVTPMVALLNLSLLVTVITVSDALVLLWTDDRWLLYLAVLLGGLSLARLCYLAAVAQARAYGDLIRVAFDFHRHSILRQMRIPEPPSLESEKVMWPRLTRWVLRGDAPWLPPSVGELNRASMLREPLLYSTKERSGEDGDDGG